MLDQRTVAKSPERDLAIRTLAGRISEISAGQPVDVSIGAAALFIVTQVDHAGDPALTAYAARTLRKVADLFNDRSENLHPAQVATSHDATHDCAQAVQRVRVDGEREVGGDA